MRVKGDREVVIVQSTPYSGQAKVAVLPWGPPRLKGTLFLILYWSVLLPALYHKLLVSWPIAGMGSQGA